ncbi:hypothetical protein, partial [Enterobacter cloacae]|uniref:hypothetical protein n=1 Tax=Enterobacter cloacae TaxID=550 RepID=UPI0019548C73
FLNFRAGSSRETRGGKAAPVALSMPAMADLFATEEQAPRAAEDLACPLADRLRPQRLEDVVGQEHLTGPEG